MRPIAKTCTRSGCSLVPPSRPIRWALLSEFEISWIRIAYVPGAANHCRDLVDDDPFMTKLRNFDPVGSNFLDALRLAFRRQAVAVTSETLSFAGENNHLHFCSYIVLTDF